MNTRARTTPLKTLVMIAVLLFTLPAYGKSKDKDVSNPAEGTRIELRVGISKDALRVETTPLDESGQIVLATLDLELDEPVYETAVPGEPVLPYIRRLVALPAYAEKIKVNIDPGEPVVIGNAALIEWAKRERPGQQSQKRPPMPPLVTIIDNQIVFYPGGDGFAPVEDFLKRSSWPAEAAAWTSSSAGSGAVMLVNLQVYPIPVASAER